MSDKEKIIKMHEAYEEYISKILEIINKKVALITEYRVKAGKEKLRNLKNAGK